MVERRKRLKMPNRLEVTLSQTSFPSRNNVDHIQKLKAHATAGGPLLIGILVVQSGLRFFGPHLSEVNEMPLIMGFNPFFEGLSIIYPLVMTNIAIKNGHRNSGFTR